MTGQLLGKRQVALADCFESLFAEVHQIHFIDRNDQMLDPQQCGDKAVATRLIQHAFARIHQQNRQFTGRGPGRHVTGVLFVAWGIGNDKFALLSGEITIRHVNGNALLALSLKAVHQQGQVELFALRTVTLAVVMQ